MRRLLKIIFCVLGTLIFVAIGAIAFGRTYNAGRVAGQQIKNEEIFWTAEMSLQNQSLEPQAREYVKAQFYHYGCLVDPQIIRRVRKVDYGPVDDTILKGLEPFPFRSDHPNDYYADLLRIRALPHAPN